MPVQSPGEQPARPTAEAATSPSRQHRPSCPPPSNPWDTATTNTPVQWGGVGVRLCIISFCERAPVLFLYKCFSVSDSATLPLYTLRNFPQHTAALQPPALLHTDSLGERQTERKRRGEERGGRRVLLSCSLTVLFVQPFLPPVYYRGNSWVYLNPHTASLYPLTHITDSHITHTQKGEQKRKGQQGVNQDHGMWAGAEWGVKGSSESIMNYCHRHTNTQHAKRDTETKN